MVEAAVTDLDRRFMAAAIRLGAGALGQTWPNPAVGAIVVKDGVVVGRGRTALGGRPHAEPTALAEAGTAARGATLYVSLEPCAHHGRTPPCADAIAAAGVAKVVAPLKDPDPRVAGTGFERLRAAGIQAVTNASDGDAESAQAGHINRIARGTPYVLLKLAVSADDAIGRQGKGNVLVTGEIARRHVQALRSRFDAILVGRGTVEADDPELTCRLAGLEGRSPVRVILDSNGRLGGDRRVFTVGQSPTWLLSAVGEENSEGRLRRFVVPRAEGGLDLAASLRRLAAEGLTRIVVEGGARVARAFLGGDLVDEVLLFRSPAALGEGAIPALSGANLESSGRFRRTERRRFGEDSMIRLLRG